MRIAIIRYLIPITTTTLEIKYKLVAVSKDIDNFKGIPLFNNFLKSLIQV